MITSFVPALVKKTRFLQLHPSSARNGLISLDYEECGAQLGGSGKAKLFWRALRRGVDPLNEPDDVGLSAKARGTVAALLDGSALIPLEQGPLTTASCGTCKWISTLVDGGQIETVLIPSGKFDRTTLCVSTQIGCDRGCRFCATGLMGIVRNLTASEKRRRMPCACMPPYLTIPASHPWHNEGARCPQSSAAERGRRMSGQRRRWG